MIGIFKNTTQAKGEPYLYCNSAKVKNVWFAGAMAAKDTGEARMDLCAWMEDGAVLRVSSDEEDVKPFYNDIPSLEDALIKKMEQILNAKIQLQ